MSAPEPKKPAKWVPIFGFLFIMCIIASILFVRPPVIVAANVATRLQQFSADLNGAAMKVGRQAVLSFGAVSIEGTGYEKYAVIQNLHFSLSAKVGTPSGNWALDTDKVSVTLDPLNDKRMVFKFVGPVTFTQNDHKTIITMPTPLKFGYFENEKDGAIQDVLTLRLPSEVTLASQAAPSGQPGTEASKTVISYDGLPEISIKHDAVAKVQSANSDLRNIIMQSGAGHDINVGAVAGSIEEKTGADNKLAGLLSLTVSDFTRRGVDGKAIGTCSLTSSIGYSGLESVMDLFGVPDKSSAAATLNKLVVTCDDFNIKFEGNFAFQPGEALPVGTVTATIDNIKALLASPLFSEQTKAELTAALPKITGQPVEALTQVVVPLKRDAGGELMLGAITAQEAAITPITQWAHPQ